jgi:hypothetical protein
MSVVSGTSREFRGKVKFLRYGSIATDGILERFVYIESSSTVVS